MRTPEKGARPDSPDLAVLPPAPAMEQVWCIGPEQASIIVSTGCRVGRHWVHPPLTLGRQWHEMYQGGGTQRHGGVQHPLVDHKYRGEEGNKQNNSFRVCILFI